MTITGHDSQFDVVIANGSLYRLDFADYIEKINGMD